MQVRGKSVYLSGENGVIIKKRRQSWNRRDRSVTARIPFNITFIFHSSFSIFHFKPPTTIANSIKMLYS